VPGRGCPNVADLVGTALAAAKLAAVTHGGAEYAR